MIEFLFLDLDDTILDFQKAEHLAIGKTLAQFGLTADETVTTRYSAINRAHWEALERGELTREQVLTGRFATLFREFGIAVDAQKVARQYEDNLSVGHYFLPGALEALQELSRHYKLYLASNGTAKVQAGRLKSADISKYFEKIFVSQQIGADKPSLAYFQRCFEQIPGFDPDRAMIVGDSLTSDILGGIRAGIATCWVNPGHKPVGQIRPDWQIEALSQLPGLLQTL